MLKVQQKEEVLEIESIHHDNDFEIPSTTVRIGNCSVEKPVEISI